MPRLLVCLLAFAALATAGGAAAADPPRPLDTPIGADLDGDGLDETVSARETTCFTNDGVRPPPCEPGGLRSIVIEASDACGQNPSGPGFGGQPIKVIALSREMDFISFARIVDADGDGQARELAFELRAGATARGVQAKVVSFRTGADGCLAVRRTLFSYPRPDSIGRRPRGTSFASGGLTVHDFVKHFPGQELRTIETYARPVDAGCCPSFQRTTFWRLVASRDAYRPYRTKLVKLRKPF
jgi:hypothetical protein